MTGPQAPPSLLRVATLNTYGLRAEWPWRRRVIAEGLRRLAPDLMAFQEVIVTAGYDQVSDLLGNGYHVVHHSDRQHDGQGISIASRWPVEQVHEVNLPIMSRSATSRTRPWSSRFRCTSRTGRWCSSTTSPTAAGS